MSAQLGSGCDFSFGIPAGIILRLTHPAAPMFDPKPSRRVFLGGAAAALATGPRLTAADMVSPGAAVVDVGTNAVAGKLVGDVHESVAGVAGWLSPVPGGVGPMTITMLLVNTLEAAGQIGG